MTDLRSPDAVRDQDEIVTRRPPVPAKRRPQRRPAVIVAGSLLAGLVAAIALVAGPFAGGREPAITGAILLGFALGWALLAVLSVRAPAGGADAARDLHVLLARAQVPGPYVIAGIRSAACSR